MKFMHIHLLGLLVFTLSGCSIQQLDYFQVDPYSKPLGTDASTPITLVLMEDVKNNLIVKGVGVKSMSVRRFRMSFGNSMVYPLQKNFEVAAVTDSIPDSGLSLVVYRVRPFWKIGGESIYTVDGESFSTSHTAAGFQVESSLYLNNEKLKDADITVYSDDMMQWVGQAHRVFMGGLVKTCETLNREVFDMEVVRRINSESW